VSARRAAPFFWSAVVIAVAVAGGSLTISSPMGWPALMPLQPDREPASAPPPASNSALPLPRRGETALARARVLASAGHLRDALAALDAVRLADPEKPDADRLRADIQRQLLQLYVSPSPVSQPSAP
jgi:hypothetical protein